MVGTAVVAVVGATDRIGCEGAGPAIPAGPVRSRPERAVRRGFAAKNPAINPRMLLAPHPEWVYPGAGDLPVRR